MGRFSKYFAFVLSISSFFSSSFAQDNNIVKIHVRSTDQNLGIAGAVVVYQDVLEGKTDSSGSMVIQRKIGINQTVKVNAVGYETVIFELDHQNYFAIVLNSLQQNIPEVEIHENQGRFRETVIAASAIDHRTIQQTQGNSEFIETMQFTPGVFVSRQGGGYGDSRITLRGFSNEDMDVNINGVTLKGVEGGWIFWSNWSGIGDFANSIEIERGIGAKSLGSNAYGGTINIETRLPDEKAKQEAGFDYSNALGPKMTVILQSGRMKNGWAVLAGANRVKGDGLVDGTGSDSWAYYFAASKNITDKNKINFRAFGAPQEHDQRSSKMHDSTFNRYGVNYNKDWGYKNGDYYTSAKNFFHKPVMALEHKYKFTSNTTLNNTLSFSMGRGGATRSFAAPLPYADAQIDFDKAIVNNQFDKDSLLLGNGSYTYGYQASHFLGNFKNRHETYSADSRITHNVSNKFSVLAGIELRMFNTHDWAEVEDLLGADFVANGADANAGMQAAKEGDKIWFNTHSRIDSETIYSQLEYKTQKWKTFFFFALMNSGFYRENFFVKSEDDNTLRRANFLNARTRLGISRDLDKHHTIFANAGWYNRPLNMDNVFVAGNELPLSTDPEMVQAFEFGHKIKYDKLNSLFNVYLMNWYNKSFIPAIFDPLTNEYLYPRIQGINASVRGLELEITYEPIKDLLLHTGFALGDWRWKGNPSALLYSTTNSPLDTIRVYAENLKICNSPQTQFFARIRTEALKNTFFVLDAIYSDRMYADYNVTSRADANYREQPYRLPSYTVFSFHGGYTLKKIPSADLEFSAHVNNILDTKYQNEALDIPGSDPLLFYGLGRNYSLGMKVKF